MNICSAYTRAVVTPIIKRVDGPAPIVYGPVVTSAPMVDPLTAQENVQVTRTQGSYAPRGGGSVAVTSNEWRVDGAPVGSGVTYTPIAADIGKALAYFESATETGGTAAGTVTRSVFIGVIQAEPVFVPDPFVQPMWELSDPKTDGDLSVQINSLPADGGAVITEVEYRIDGGNWASSNGTGSFEVSGLANGVSVDVQLRAVNIMGAGAGGDTKSETPSAVTVFSPSSITGLSSWIRADTAVSVDGGNMVTSVMDVRDATYPDQVGAPSIGGLAGCAIDVSSGEVLYWKNPSYATTPASVTKSPVIAHALRIMSSHGVNLTDNITMEAGDFEGSETTPPLAAGDTMSLRDLMHISMLESANAATRCVARVLGREILSDPAAPPQVAIEAFIADLTAALKAEGICGFHMESVSGVYDFEDEMLGGPADSDHVATAHAVAEWARYSHLTSGMDAIWGAESHSYVITTGPNAGTNTINHLIGMATDEDVYGAKGGALPGLAGKALHAVADLPDGRKIAVSVLQSHTRESDARAIVTYCAGVPAGSGMAANYILPGNGVQLRQEGSYPAPILVSDAIGAAFDFGSATDSVGPYLRADIPNIRTLFFVWDREVDQVASTVWEAWMDIWGGTVQNVERLTTDQGTNGWWSKPPGVTIYKNAVATDALLPFERCVVAITNSKGDSLGIFGSGRNDKYRNLSGKVREILTFDRILNSSEIQQVTSYLIGEYGIS